jgi:hypothetical protein
VIATVLALAGAILAAASGGPVSVSSGDPTGCVVLQVSP